MNLPLVNIIVVTFNEYHYTAECLGSLLSDNYENKKIFLVDNGSDKDIYQNFYNKNKDNPEIEFIRSEKNLGFGGGCNLALREIKEGYVAILNNDVEVEKNWLSPIIEYMKNYPEVGACQPKIKDIKGRDYFEYAGAAGGFMDVYGYPFTRGRVFYTLEKDEGQYDNIIDLVWCSGTCFVTKKEVIDKIGLFDEIFFMYGEEADLCWRMNHAGYRIVFIPGSVVYHHGGGTMRKYKFNKTFYLHRNGLILLFKNYSKNELWKYFPGRMTFDFVNFFYYFFNFHFRLCLALMKSYSSFLALLQVILGNREKTNELKLQFSKKYPYPLYPRSIIFDYFIKKKKKFSQLEF